MELVTVKLGLEEEESTLLTRACRKLGWRPKEVATFLLVRRSVDARDKSAIKLVYTVGLSRTGETLPTYTPPGAQAGKYRPIVVGFGPAGMLAAHVLAKAGLRPIVLERGLKVDERTAKVQAFWQEGKLDPECNVQFGEGGAGAFSDGKLNTGTGDKVLQRTVLELFVKHGAPESILYDAKPHVGTDKLKEVCRGVRGEIEALGGEIRFGVKVLDVVEGSPHRVVTTEGDLLADEVVLAIGHSARDTYQALSSGGSPCRPSPLRWALGSSICRPISTAPCGGSLPLTPVWAWPTIAWSSIPRTGACTAFVCARAATSWPPRPTRAPWSPTV